LGDSSRFHDGFGNDGEAGRQQNDVCSLKI
jgi:hypothetical protein